MEKGSVVAAVAALLSAVPTVKPAVAQLPEFDEGCVVLGEVVRQAAVRKIHALHAEPASLQAAALIDSRVLHTCGSTSRAVSAAYATALAEFGMYVRWNYLSPDAGTVCSGRDIRVCDPFSDPMGPRLTASDLAFVVNSWDRMRAGVAVHMPWGTSSDVSYFRASTLARSLRAARFAEREASLVFSIEKQ